MRDTDADAFRELIEPYRRELHVHCYRMLGSLHDAEDALQETLLAAWNGFAAFEERSSLRTWLYRIATNRCLNARRSAARHPVRPWDGAGVVLPEGAAATNEVTWLEPFPDVADTYERTESISLAFVTALQALPPRQVAVLVLRDVLGFPAAEVATMLGSTVESVTSALKRARARLHGVRPQAEPSDDALVARFVRAYQESDIDGLVALLTDDVFMAMPPLPLEYRGREAIAEFFARVFASGRRRLVETSANGGQPAFGVYSGERGSGLIVLTVTGGRIGAMTRFEPTVLPWFNLPACLSS
jgi:RNA polymerase sigma-70 factor (TIGR02960 family)